MSPDPAARTVGARRMKAIDGAALRRLTPILRRLWTHIEDLREIERLRTTPDCQFFDWQNVDAIEERLAEVWAILTPGGVRLPSDAGFATRNVVVSLANDLPASRQHLAGCYIDRAEVLEFARSVRAGIVGYALKVLEREYPEPIATNPTASTAIVAPAISAAIPESQRIQGGWVKATTRQMARAFDISRGDGWTKTAERAKGDHILDYDYDAGMVLPASPEAAKALETERGKDGRKRANRRRA